MEGDDVFRTPPERTPTGSPTLSAYPNNSAIKPLPAIHRGSITSLLSNSSPVLRSGSPAVEEDEFEEDDFRTPMLTDAQAEQQREGGFLEGALSDRPGTSASTEPEADKEPSSISPPLAGPSTSLLASSPDSRKQMRRSMHKTLRSDSSSHGHHRRQKGSRSESGLLPEDAIVDGAELAAPGEGLKRHEGSFTVHGKKASVITFGGEWAHMDTGERLKILARHESGRDGIVRAEDSKGKGPALVSPRRSSVSLKERDRADGLHGQGETGTAKALRKFSSSSAPLYEDLAKVREEARENGHADIESEDEDEVVTPKGKGPS